MYNTRIFSKIFSSSRQFAKEFFDSDLAISIDEKYIKQLYNLLYAEYGNSPIANDDENQFKYRLWSIIFKHGPEWIANLEIQEKVRKMSEEDFMKGSEVVMNHANNPGTPPGTEGTGEIGYVDDQSVSKRKRGVAEALQFRQQMLSSDFTTIFVNRFKPLFSPFALPGYGPRYLGDEEDEEN